MDQGAGLSFCVLGCYPKSSRENFARSDVGHPHELFTGFLKRYVPQAAVDVLFIADEDTPLPTGEALRAYDGWLWTGSDLTIYHEKDERVTRQIALAQDLLRAGAKCCGSCWGLQIAAYAAGGGVELNPNGREWGIARDIELTAAGKASPLLADKPGRFDAFIMHLDEVTRLPSGTARLAGNAHTRVQAAVVEHAGGVFWGTQYHPEYNFHEMGRLLKARAAALVKEGFFQNENLVRAHADKMLALHKDPGSRELREELKVGDDILDPNIRELELRHWVDFVAGSPKG
ncbi:MAG: type 1 glutamine amidotransferase [Elusimicrobiota bacterium]